MTTTLHGYDWYTYPRGPRDVLLCLIGQHRKVMSALDDGVYVQRCSCGAMRLGWVQGWSRTEHWWFRQGEKTPVDSVA